MKKVFWIKPIIPAVIIILLATDCKKIEEQATIIKSELKSDSKTDSKSGANPDSLLVIDADSNIYHTVTIGSQIWLVENLRTKKYLNGDQIPSYLSAEQWCNNTIGACKIGNDTYGNIYNAYAVEDSRRLCPAGWHIPSASEWDTLLNYLGGESIAGGPLKETGTTHWLDPNVGATNRSGFTALPGGNYNPRTGSEYIQSVGSNAVWWSCSKEDLWFWTVQCSFASTDAVRTEMLPVDGLSVRCIKGDPDPNTLVTHPSTIIIGQGDTISNGPAEAITEPVTDRTATGVTLNGTVYASGVPTTVTFEFAEEKSIIPLSDVVWQTVTADQSPLSGEEDVQVSAKLEGLSRGTYMYRVKAVSSLGTKYGSILEVDILGTGGQSPTVTTMAATNISSNGAILNGTVNANGLSTKVTFEYGVWVGGKPGWIWWRNIPAEQSPVTGTTLINVSKDITGLRGLRSGTRHPFRVKAENSCGTVYGEILSFTLQ